MKVRKELVVTYFDSLSEEFPKELKSTRNLKSEIRSRPYSRRWFTRNVRNLACSGLRIFPGSLDKLTRGRGMWHAWERRE
jgi:hypothetical protein